MQQTVTVSIPHRLGKEEAMRRLKSGFGRAQGFAGLNITEQEWTDSRLRFSASALGQTAAGTVDIADDHVRIEVTLPWLLAQLAEKAKAMIQKQTQVLLEKK
jgi:hypothetical protein